MDRLAPPMAPDTLRTLRAINERFYRTQAAGFAARRTRPWPGMERLLCELPEPPMRVLDVGCGHGRFAALLAADRRVRGLPQPHYVGVDRSRALLERARRRDDVPEGARWLERDIEAEAPEERGLPQGPFDLVVMIAVVHHIAGEARRAALLRELATRLVPGGTLAVAFWRSAADDRRRHLDWRRVGIEPATLEEGDRLLSFDGERGGIRYGHFASEAELRRMECAPGHPVVLRYLDDGPQRQSNAYLLWRRPA